MEHKRKAQISARIAAQLAAGKTLRDAIDTVLGEGRYDQLVSEAYEQLRARGPVVLQ
jgi:hypothetical protein